MDDLTAIPKGWREQLTAKGVSVGRSTVHDVRPEDILPRQPLLDNPSNRPACFLLGIDC